MLNETKNFTILTTNHVINYNQILHNYIKNIEDKKKIELNELMKQKGIITRKFDEMEVGADLEHEYVDIFLERNYSFRLSLKNKNLFDEMCRKLKYTSNNHNPLLLKNPHDYTNFLEIKKIYPDAKFIFIHRNPIKVINSVMHLWKTHFSSKNQYIALYSKRYEKCYDNILIRLLLRFFYCSKFPISIIREIFKVSKGNKNYLKNINKLSKKDFISITYENLCNNPNKEIRNILDFLNLECNINYDNYINKRTLGIKPEVEFMKNYILNKNELYCDKFNYK